jgi:hypothetical protein
VALSHNSLANYYKTIFSLAQHHKYSITELENLIPFERDIYVELLMEYLKELEDAKQRSK